MENSCNDYWLQHFLFLTLNLILIFFVLNCVSTHYWTLKIKAFHICTNKKSIPRILFNSYVRIIKYIKITINKNKFKLIDVCRRLLLEYYSITVHAGVLLELLPWRQVQTLHAKSISSRVLTFTFQDFLEEPFYRLERKK